MRWRHIEISSLDWWEHNGSGHVITNEPLLSGEGMVGGWVLDFWISSWTRSNVGSWTVCEGVTVPSVGMIKFSPQENGGSAEDREGKVRGDPVYLGSSSLKVSDKIPEGDAMDDDEGELRCAASPRP